MNFDTLFNLYFGKPSNTRFEEFVDWIDYHRIPERKQQLIKDAKNRVSDLFHKCMSSPSVFENISKDEIWTGNEIELPLFK